MFEKVKLQMKNFKEATVRVNSKEKSCTIKHRYSWIDDIKIVYLDKTNCYHLYSKVPKTKLENNWAVYRWLRGVDKYTCENSFDTEDSLIEYINNKYYLSEE